MKKKILFLVASFLLISFSFVGLTLAFMSNKEESSNVFTIGKVSIKLDESDVDELGNKISDKRVLENNYHLMPGYTYIKDPTITVLNESNDSYIRILITINSIEEMKSIYGEEFTPNNVYSDWSNKWNFINKKINEDESITFEYRYIEKVNGLNGDNKLEPIFKTFTIPGKATINELENLKNLKIDIKGQAIQAYGFEDANDAWQSFTKQNGE